MERSNETWLAQLSTAGPDQQSALSDLREALLRGLRRALSTRAGTDEAFHEDAAQDSLIRILERLPQFEGRSRFVTWATSIAIRVAMSELRRRRWKDVSLDDVVANSDFALRGATGVVSEPSEHSERQAILDTMHDVIRHELTERQRTALLAELKGVPLDELAGRLGSNRNALYKLTHDARKRLKRGLEAAGYRADEIHAAFAG